MVNLERRYKSLQARAGFTVAVVKLRFCMTLLDCPTATVNPACVHKVPYVFDFDCEKKLMLSRVLAGLISACYVSSIVIAMSRAVEPWRSLGRDSSQGFVEPLREEREDVPLKGLIAPLDSMPPVDFAFAYGSGVFTQALHSRARSNEVCVRHAAQSLQYVRIMFVKRDVGVPWCL
ncbi:hypothetical protein M758_10G170800 [Ceratodon purpureus]|nr:hypothetical protein M758_10G170800 [Ceratodon purpureus]